MIRPAFLRRRSKLPATLTALLVILGVLAVPQAALALNGTALQLNGNSQYVTMGAATASLGATSFTLETWFKRMGTGVGTSTGQITNAIPLVTKGRSQADASTADMNYFLGIDGSSNKLVADFEEGATGTTPGLNHPITGTTIVTSNVWHHAAATYDAATGIWHLYLDGNADGTVTVSPAQPPRADSLQHAALGTAMNTSGTPAGFFNGIMDESRIWNVARTQAQIQGAMNTELTSGTGILARWGYNEGAGTTLASNPAGVTGTVVASPIWVGGFNTPVASGPPDQPVLVSPADGASGLTGSPQLTVAVSDPQSDPLTVVFYARPWKSGVFNPIATNSNVPSNTNSSTIWSGAKPGQRYEWYATVADAGTTVAGPTASFSMASGGDPVLIGAGDIAACGASNADAAATRAIMTGVEGQVFTLGDNAYPIGDPASYTNCYAPTWGAEKARTKPATGNKEYESSPVLSGYVGYFGAAQGTPGGHTYYSYDVPNSNWHVVVLDSECQLNTGGCAAGSAQELWLKADLNANLSKNVMAMWHRPAYSSGSSNSALMQPMLADCYAKGVDLILNGHAHLYERLEPVNSSNQTDNAFGIRTFVVGTGGSSHGVIGTISSHSQVLDNTTFGVMKLTLHPTSYDYQFMPIENGTVTDSGTQAVHGRPGNALPVATPQSVSTARNTAKTITLAGTDGNGDPLTFSVATLPTHGNLYDGPAATGTPLTAGAAVTDPLARVTYVPTTGYLGGDSFTFQASDGSPSSPATVSINVTNTAPTFNQNLPNRTDAEGAVINLGSGATDSEGDPLTYAASNLPPGLSINTATGQITGTIASNGNASSPYATAVTVSEDGGATVAATDTFTWTVTNTNQPPSFTQDIAGLADEEGDIINQSHPATDPDGDTLTYGATNLPPGLSVNTSTGAITGTISFTAAPNSPYAVSLTVSDNGGVTTVTDTFPWSVTNKNRTPTLNQNFTGFTNLEGDNVSQAVGATDPDGDTLFFAATGLPPGLAINSTTGQITGMVSQTAANGSPYGSAQVKVSDNGGLSFGDTDTFSWTINPTNILPTFNQNLGDRTKGESRSVSLSAAATDLDGDPLTYTALNLPPGLSINASTGLISGTVSPGAATGSPYAVTLRVSDNGGTTTGDSDTFSWTITSNGAPSFDSPLDDQSNNEGAVISLSDPATDPNGDPLTFSATGLPPGLSINPSTGLISGTISYAASLGSPYTVTIKVSDDGGETISAADSLQWTVIETNQPPTFSQDYQDRADDQNDVINLQFSATDGDGQTVSYGAFGLPTGLHINQNTGAVFGTIDANAAANSPYSVRLTASDDGGITIGTSDYFQWTVRTNQLPTFNQNQGDVSGDEGDVVSLPAPASDINDDPLTYSATGLPAGLSMSPTTGTISGTISFTAAAGSPYSVALHVSDDGGTTNGATDTFLWTVNNKNRLPAFNQNYTTRTDAENAVITMAAPATDPDGDILLYAGTSLPPGLSINPSTGTVSGTIDFTGAAGSPYATVLKVSDDGGTTFATDTFSWTVTNTNKLPTFDQDLGDRTSAETDVVALSATASDFDGDSLKYAATNLPPGLSIGASNGQITGTIAFTGAASSPYSVSITVSDDNGVTVGATDTFSWTVTNTNQPPTFDQNLQDRTDGDSASISLSAHATDGDGQAVTYAATGLPTGLSINSATGLISGTIAANAHNSSPFSVTVKASDDGGATFGATDTLTWTVTPQTDVIFRSSSSAAASGKSVAVPKPAGVLSGDVMVAIVGVRSNATITAPAGWTLAQLTSNGTTIRQATYWKVATGSEPASYTFTFNASRASSGAIAAYSGVNTTNPVDVFSGGTATSTSISAPSVTTGFNKDMIIGGFAIANSSAISPPAGMTERTELASGSSIKVEVAEAVLASAGATGVRTATAASSGANVGQLLALRAAPGGGGGGNQPPTFDQNLPNRTDAQGAVISMSAHATDPESNPLLYAATGLPTGLSINTSTGLITGTISNTAAAGSPYSTSITVSDDNGATVGATDTFTWTVTGGGGGGSITFRASSTASNGTATSLTLPEPAGVVSGDVMAAVFSVRSNPNATAPAGWALASMTPNGTTVRQFVYTKVATGSEPASYVWTFDQSRAASGGILAYTGVNTSNPVDVVGGSVGSTVNIVAPSVTTTQNGDVVIGGFSIANSSAIAPPAGMTERVEIASGSNVKTEISDYTLASAGATGAKTAVAGSAASDVGQLVALRPAGGGGGGNQLPTFDQNLANRTDAQGNAISLSAHATDPESNPLLYAATGLPTGLSINTSTGLITGTVSNTAATGSPYSTSITVSDDNGATVGATDTLTWTVTAGGGGGSIVFRSASTGANAVGSNVVIPAPAGMQANDVMVAVLDVKVTPTMTPPAGWNLVSTTANGTNFTQRVYTKVATASEPASYTFTINESRAISGAISAYSGVNTTTPVEVAGTAGLGTTTSIAAPSVNSAFNGAMVIGAFGINADSTITEPAGMTERGEIVSATRIRTEISDVVLASAGATGTKTATAATAAATIGQLIVLKPA